ncbi:hypothetical protein NKG05_13165 [Oerskovia sp. M15]
MRATHRRVVAGGTAVAAALALGACGFGPRSTATDTYTETDEITSVRLDLDAGSVMLRGSDEVTAASISRTLDYTGTLPEGDTHRVEDGVLVLAAAASTARRATRSTFPPGSPSAERRRTGRST